MVFGDYVINGALAAAFEVSTGTVRNANPPIYNIVSSNDYVKTFGKFIVFSSIHSTSTLIR